MYVMDVADVTDAWRYQKFRFGLGSPGIRVDSLGLLVGK